MSSDIELSLTKISKFTTNDYIKLFENMLLFEYCNDNIVSAIYSKLTSDPDQYSSASTLVTILTAISKSSLMKSKSYITKQFLPLLHYYFNYLIDNFNTIFSPSSDLNLISSESCKTNFKIIYIFRYICLYEHNSKVNIDILLLVISRVFKFLSKHVSAIILDAPDYSYRYYENNPYLAKHYLTFNRVPEINSSQKRNFFLQYYCLLIDPMMKHMPVEMQQFLLPVQIITKLVETFNNLKLNSEYETMIYKLMLKNVPNSEEVIEFFETIPDKNIAKELHEWYIKKQ